MAFNSLMHERNIYKERPDFAKIALDYPEFRKYAISDKKGKYRVDYTDPNSLRMLTKILLKKDFDVNVEIPLGFLIPTVPQRLNYILWIEDLLNVLPKRNETIRGIDIGTGPCAILSLLGSKKNGWNFVSTETADEAIQWAEKNIQTNNLQSSIKIIKVNKGSILHEVLSTNEENYDFCVCNPPFFENIEDIRKKPPGMKKKLDIFAKKEEIFSEGGEVSFVKQMLKDSLAFKNRIRLHTSMFGKKKSYLEILKELRNVEGVTYTKTEFCQGNTIRWGVAWTFLESVDFEKTERPKLKKPKKAKPPLVHSISRITTDGNIRSVQEVLESMVDSFLELEILPKIIKSAENYAEIEVTSNKNSWTNQRRKRRELLKSKMNEAVNVSETINLNDLNNEVLPSAIVGKSNLTDSAEKLSVTSDSKNVHQDQGKLPCIDETLTSIDSVTIEKQTAEHKDFADTSVQHETAFMDSQNLKNSTLSHKRKRDDATDNSGLSSHVSDHQEDNKPVLTESPENDILPQSKKVKNSESPCKKPEEEEIHLDTSPKKNINQIKNNQQDIPSDFTVPLLFCAIKVRKTKDNILLEFNCAPEYNRDSMYQVFQLFKNKFQ